MPREPHRQPTASPPSQEVTHESWLRRAVAIPSVRVSPRALLTPGEVLGDRFEILALAGSGGMGAVYSATDTRTLQRVAIKVVTSREPDGPERFLREAHVLAELQHPCIVRYLASGATEDGCQFLVMEWLAGEDLAARLARARLGVEDSLTLLRRVALGAAAAHARGIIHRDIKPSNIFLPDRELAASKLIDFGVARLLEDSSGLLTQPGAVLGTVGYMSPEQAMGAENLDARADVFALGCVLYECLTGRPAFSGVNAVAALLKVLREEPPRAGELLPNVHPGIDALLAKMLAKDPPRRLADASEVLQALAALERAPTAVAVRAAPISASERSVAAVVLGGPLWPGRLDLAAIAALTREFDAEPVATYAGALAVVFTGPIAATDLVQRAVRCALRLARALPELRFAVATGRTEQLSERAPTGSAIDRAAQLMAAECELGCEVAIDELTYSLLGSSFSLRERAGGWLVVAELGPLESERLVLGKPTPFLGRDKELTLLSVTLRECIEDSVAQAVLVTGPPGQGKSRLRREFMALSAREGLRIVGVRAETEGQRSSLSLIKRFVRNALGLHDADEYAKLELRVAEHCAPELSPRIAGFLGELLGTPALDPAGSELRAARSDPKLMSQWLRQTFREWLIQLARRGPLLITLDDLQWADAASLEFLGEALRAVHDQPLLVVALAREEFHQHNARFLAGTPLQRVALGRLTARTAERLVRTVLGSMADAALARIVERADGNPFYLEELIRDAAHGDRRSVPENVLALVQSR
ncbi:MAG TPA: protein kinase, partial [Polyangiales bacterium]|nr:protein kinase [Polyangiales bacterium]